MECLNREMLESERIGVIRRFIDGDDEALAVLCAHHKGKMTKEASRRLRCLRIAPCQFDGDDAVNGALFRIRQARSGGRVFLLESSKDFWKLFSVTLRHVILDAKDHFDAVKRGGSGSTWSGRRERQGAALKEETRRAFRRTEADLDQFRSELPSTEKSILARLELQDFLDHLATRILQEILTMSIQGYSGYEIALQLGVSQRTVKRKQAVIRRIYLNFDLPD